MSHLIWGWNHDRKGRIMFEVILWLYFWGVLLQNTQFDMGSLCLCHSRNFFFKFLYCSVRNYRILSFMFFPFQNVLWKNTSVSHHQHSSFRILKSIPFLIFIYLWWRSIFAFMCKTPHWSLTHHLLSSRWLFTSAGLKSGRRNPLKIKNFQF